MQGSYNDFATEMIAESYRSGNPKKPNRKNKITKNRKRFRTGMEADAFDSGKDISEIAKREVEKNRGQIEKYVMSKGEMPQKDLHELCAQAIMLRGEDIEKFATAMDCSYEDAMHYIEEAESKAADINSAEADSFIGEILEAVGTIASGPLQKAVDKRKTAGKKPGVLGFLNNLFKPSASQLAAAPNGTDAMGAAYSQLAASQLGALAGNALDAQSGKKGIGGFLSGIFDGLKANETKKQVNKMLPWIIGGVVVLILITILITKGASKR